MFSDISPVLIRLARLKKSPGKRSGAELRRRDLRTDNEKGRQWTRWKQARRAAGIWPNL